MTAWLRLLVAALAATVVGCGGSGGTSPPPTTWVVLGSSTAAGVGASPEHGWVALLATSVQGRAAIDNRARAGAVTYHALPAEAARPVGRPASDPSQDVDRALSAKPALIVLAFPSNDAMARYATEETVDNLLQIRARARAQGAAVLMLSSQPRDDADASQRAAMTSVDRTLAAELGSCFVDVHDALASASGGISAPYHAGDGVHLNDAGHQLLFERVRAALTSGRCAALVSP